MAKRFSPRALALFEDASASVPLRQLDRAFQNVDIRLGEDPGGSEGSRRTQFRRYVASIDQHDPRDLDRLGAALGALIGEVATSKVEFLVNAAGRDGFVFADGVFRPAADNANAFAVTRVEDLAFVDERGARLLVLTIESPRDAVRGAKELVESVCRTILRSMGKAVPGKTADSVDIVESTLQALDVVSDRIGVDELVARFLRQLGDIVARFAEMRSVSSGHARLAVGAAVTLAAFVAQTYAERPSRVRAKRR